MDIISSRKNVDFKFLNGQITLDKTIIVFSNYFIVGDYLAYDGGYIKITKIHFGFVHDYSFIGKCNLCIYK